jgi:hypothetical protein
VEVKRLRGKYKKVVKQKYFDKENLHIALGVDACGSSDVGTESKRGGKD